VVIMVNPIPVDCSIQLSSTAADIYPGQEFCVTIADAASTNYIWTPANNVTQNGTQFCLNPSETTTYTVKNADATCTEEAQIIVTVLNEVIAPCIAVDKTVADINIGEEVCVEVTGIGGYVWSPTTNMIRSGDTYCFNPSETTVYTIRSTEAGCTEEIQVRINVWDGSEDTIPTMSEWGLMIFALLVLNLGVIFLYRREDMLVS